MRALVVDDPDSRRVTSRFLSAADARVREAADGETALVLRAAASSFSPPTLDTPLIDAS